jgi:hypothetical protein
MSLSGFRVRGLGHRGWSLGWWVWGVGCWVWGSEEDLAELGVVVVEDALELLQGLDRRRWRHGNVVEVLLLRRRERCTVWRVRHLAAIGSPNARGCVRGWVDAGRDGERGREGRRGREEGETRRERASTTDATAPTLFPSKPTPQPSTLNQNLSPSHPPDHIPPSPSPPPPLPPLQHT